MRLFSHRRLSLLLIVLGSLGLYSLTFGSSGNPPAGGDSHAVLDILLQLMVVLMAAKLGGDLFERIGQPPVLGELVLGMVIGNLHLVGIHIFDSFGSNLTLEILAEIGVIILLFEIGLESTVSEMLKVGVTSFVVALLGVIVPFFLGWGVGAWFLPHESMYVHIFLGATLTATSVGITARVLKDIGKLKTREAQIILGAAVIDDIMGLVILAVVAGIISAAAGGSGPGIGTLGILWICAKAVLFVIGALVFGSYLLPRYFKLLFKLKGSGILLSFSLLVCFGLAYLAGLMGLAPIVGAFAAGLILDKVQYKNFTERGEHRLEELINPIATFLVPIFFVRMGAMVNLTTFGQIEILGFAACMTLAAVVGKQVCSLAIWDRTTNRMAIGLGMIPRGEVGLIFASIGAKMMLDGEPVVSASTYSAVVIMVIVTTLITPPLLKWSLMRSRART
jgi:Kef-type K+ transport system membrane component KefB